MKRYKRKTGSAVLLFICCVLLSVGCSGKMTPKKLMSSVSKNLADAKSVSNTLSMYIELEDVLNTMKVSMDMQMQNTADPKAGHAKGTAEVDFSGTKVGSDIEIYQVNEGDEFVTYSSMYDKWSRESAANSVKSSFNGNLFQEADDSIKSFHIAEQAVQLDDKDCYQMYGDISGKELLGFMGADMMGAFGLVEIPAEEALVNLEIPVTIEVYQEELLPARVIIDMTDVMNDLYDEYDKSTNVNDFTIELGYTGFDEVDKIEVPQDVLEACAS